MKTRSGLLLCSLICSTLLTACDDMPEWMGGAEEKPPLPGTRVSALTDVTQIKADASLEQTSVNVPEIQANTDWAAEGGSNSGLTGNLAWTGFKQQDSVKIGDGNDWEEHAMVNPVVAGGSVFAVDAKGYVTAHDAARIDTVKWTSNAVVETDEPDVLGGGVAFDDGKLFVTSGYGKVAGLDAATGKVLWRSTLGTPIRNAPKAAAGKVYVLSSDNQLLVLDATSGKTLWNHRGITENVGFATAVSPSVKDSMVVVPYSSGEIHALDATSGQEVWSDTLILSRHTTATGGFSGIGGAPVIADDNVYAGGSGGFFASITLLSGRRVWEQDIPSLNPAWIAGDFVYLLSESQQLFCLYKADGRVKWTTQLPRYENEPKRKGAYVWYGPVMAGGQLLVAGRHGKMLALAPKDGSTVGTIDIPDNIINNPVVAGGKLYFITQDARLHSLY